MTARASRAGRSRVSVWHRASCAAVAVACLGPFVAAAQSRDSEAGRRAVLERSIEAIRADYPDVATISAAALMSMLPSEDVVLVDVRTGKGACGIHPSRRDRRKGLRRRVGRAGGGGEDRGGLLHHRRPKFGTTRAGWESGASGYSTWREASWPGPTPGVSS